MMGQVNLVRLGRKFLNDGGSITLTTGILADEPVDMTTSAAMVNHVNGFEPQLTTIWSLEMVDW